MEKGHNQFQPVENLPTSQPTSRLSARQVAMVYLARLLETRPAVFWGGLWASLFLVMMVSLSSLLSPGSPGRMASGAAFGSSSTKTAQEVKQKNRVPLWLFGAIALSCTAGSILVSKQLTRTSNSRPFPRPQSQVHPARAPKPPRVRRQTPKRLKPYSPAEVPLATMHQAPAAAKPPTRTPAPAQLPPQLTMPPQLYPPTKRVQRPVPPPVMTPSTRVSVTVVPDDENHPLDWGTASLADAVDLRKRHSVADWMSENPNLGH